MPLCTQFRSQKQYYPLYPFAYQHRGRRPSPEPKPAVYRWTFPYGRMHQPSAPGMPHSRHGEHGRSQSRSSKRRHVHFADRPTVIDLPTSPGEVGGPPSDPSYAIALPRSPSPFRTAAAEYPLRPSPSPPSSHPAATARQVPSTPIQSRPHHWHSAPATATSGLHDLLASFPPGLWDLRQNARPPYHPLHRPRFLEPAFPPSPSHRQPRSITLSFRPCDRPELSWTAQVVVNDGSCRKPLTVDGVLCAISTELFRRSVCEDVRLEGEGHPCFAEARKAHRIRTRRGHTGRPHFDDAFRNVDLFHADRGRGLYFEGLRPERVDGGEVVYVVKVGCA